VAEVLELLQREQPRANDQVEKSFCDLPSISASSGVVVPTGGNLHVTGFVRPFTTKLVER
jgi:hypothetical protein